MVLPPLRARREVLAPTIRELLARRGWKDGDLGISGPNLERLIAYAWPGNVRELRNLLDRALALSPKARSFAELRFSLPGDPVGEREDFDYHGELPYAEAKQRLLDAFEARYLEDLIARNDGNISAAAREAELDRKHLRTLLRKHGLV